MLILMIVVLKWIDERALGSENCERLGSLGRIPEVVRSRERKKIGVNMGDSVDLC